MNVDVVLPCLDEAEALPWVLGRIPAGWRAVVVDNGSSDGSADVARSLGAHVVEVVGCPDPPALLLEQQTAGVWLPTETQGVPCQGANLLRSVRIDPGAEVTGRLRVTAPGDFRVRALVAPPQLAGLATSVTTRGFVVRGS